MDKVKIVVASSNANKIREIGEILPDVECVSMRELGYDGEIEETGTTFRKNAYIKAKFIAEKFNMPALADDSGLCVDALGGAPGIYSARFSGGGDRENRAYLLELLKGQDDRLAHFECAVCLYYPDGRTLFGEGRADGRILHGEVGANGFGYDSLFYSFDLKKSFAEAGADEKNRVSHRYRALCDLRDKL